MIAREHILPSVMIALSLGAAAFYVPSGDRPHILYWIAAAAITVAVTFKF